MILFLRILCGAFTFMLIAFMAVQYNDPDGPLWLGIYCVPAVLAGLVAIRPAVSTSPWARWVLRLAIVAGLVGCVYFFPRTPRWWASEVWYETETAREGMGMMIVLLVLLVVQATVASVRRQQRII